MKFLKSMPKQKLQIFVMVIIGVLAGLGLVGNFFIADELTKISEQKERETKLTADVQEAEGRIRGEQATEGVRDQMRAFVVDQQSRMVTGDPFSWVVREINLLGEKYGMKDVGLSPQGKVGGGQFDLYVTQVAFQGGYDEIGKFVMDLENQFPLSQIRNITISPGGTDVKHNCHAVLELALAVRPADPVKKTLKVDPKGAKKPEGKKA